MRHVYTRRKTPSIIDHMILRHRLGSLENGNTLQKLNTKLLKNEQRCTNYASLSHNNEYTSWEQ